MWLKKIHFGISAHLFLVENDHFLMFLTPDASAGGFCLIRLPLRAHSIYATSLWSSGTPPHGAGRTERPVSAALHIVPVQTGSWIEQEPNRLDQRETSI